MEQHPRSPELVTQHGEAIGKRRPLQLHEDLSAVRKEGVHALCFRLTVEAEREVGASHRFALWNVSTHQYGCADLDAGVQHLVLPVGGQIGIGQFPMPVYSGDPAIEVFLIEAERVLAVSAVIQVDIESHFESLRSCHCYRNGKQQAAPSPPWLEPA